jgi:small subunit ribosomal protein S6
MSDTTGQILSVSALRNTKREYETIIILRANTNKAGILELAHKMQAVFEKFQARLIKIENWGSRTLAYPINRQATGIYLYWRYIGGSDIVHEFERNLKLSDTILRYYTVKIDEDVDPAARPSEITEDLLQTISEPPPEPEPEPVREDEDRDRDRDHHRDRYNHDNDDEDGLEEGVN